MGTRFGKYALLRKLAEGGMAEVFLARQQGMEGFEKLVVLKRILTALSREADFIKMFLNEARVAARLNHPNVVQIWDLGRIDDLYFIAMEYVHGEDLREIVKVAAERKRRPPPGLVCRVLADTLGGLHYAHTRTGSDGRPLGLVHRDVSPQNVIVTYAGTTKLVDFGIAKATRATSEQTQAGLFKGKFAYMSPEQSRGQPVDARSDVFAVGILLWELLTWRRLFKRPSEMATLIAVGEDAIPPPRSIDPTLPPELERIVMKALARPLGERYQTAQEMRADLEALIRAQRWEADGLSLERYLAELFADKLKAQELDMRAAGAASLDDFLLGVNEGTEISWMDPSGKRGTSVELPATDEVYDDGLTDQATDLDHRAPPPRGSAPRPAPKPATDRSSPALDPARAPTVSTDLPSAPTVIAQSGPSPFAMTMPQAAIGGGETAQQTALNDTARQPALDLKPRLSPGMRRGLVIGSAATVVAAIGLSVAFWPSSAAAPAPAVIDSTPLKPAATQVAPAHLPNTATLLITTDAPAVISVDGNASPMGVAATVQVKAGVQHVVTVQRPGHSLHTVHVPILAQGEQLPLHVKVR